MMHRCFADGDDGADGGDGTVVMLIVLLSSDSIFFVFLMPCVCSRVVSARAERAVQEHHHDHLHHICDHVCGVHSIDQVIFMMVPR